MPNIRKCMNKRAIHWRMKYDTCIYKESGMKKQKLWIIISRIMGYKIETSQSSILGIIHIESPELWTNFLALNTAQTVMEKITWLPLNTFIC